MFNTFNKKTWQLIVLNLLFWIIITIIAASLYFVSFGENYDGGWWSFFWRQLPIWMFWGIVSIPIFQLIRFLKKRQLPIWKQTLIHFLFFGGLFFFFYVFFMSYNLYLSGNQIHLEAIFQVAGLRFVLNYILNLLIYLLVVVFIYGWYWYTDLQKSELEKSVIQAQLHEAQLNMLTAQIHPHFLFNALNSISGLMRAENNQAAIKAIADLGQLLRWSLEYQPNQFIPLRLELDFINQYLKMEHLRFGDKLNIKLEISPEVETISIPALILQPLVENAIKHGVYKSNQPGTLKIDIKKEGKYILISIINDCPKIPQHQLLKQPPGIGMANVNQRLSTIYKNQNFVFEVKVLNENQVQAFLKLPL